MQKREQAAETLVEAVMLSNRDEQILKAVHDYRFMTARDVCYLFYSPGSITRVRELLANLTHKQILHRFNMPQTKMTKPEQIYALGSLGWQLLAKEGVKRYHRPYWLDTLKYSYLFHSLSITRFCVACQYFIKDKPDIEIRLLNERNYNLPQSYTVIPDAFLLFKLWREEFPVLLEIDCGTEGQTQFKKGIAARIEFIRSGNYEKVFGVKAANICYVVVMEEEKSRKRRRDLLRKWTMEVLEEQNRRNWSRVFRFAESDLKDMYSFGLMREPVWYVGDRSVTLFGE